MAYCCEPFQFCRVTGKSLATEILHVTLYKCYFISSDTNQLFYRISLLKQITTTAQQCRTKTIA